MERPKEEIPKVIHLLTEGSPTEQKYALETYFLPDAAFIHPLCRAPSFSNITIPLIGVINSRWVIWMIYRWYKILSPKIVLDVECSGFDETCPILFVNIHQIFSIWFVPFYKSDVHLTTILHLKRSEEDGRWYIKTQEDLYQTSEVVKFFWPGGTVVMYLFQLCATLLCILGALVMKPQTMLAQWIDNKKERAKAKNEKMEL
ncbi:hypothetical protein F5884DRAFT_401389 [Xylogone sp. PMI_703]|nr:hypothetical protein F5884DRAFT_401389 [Xylogone sp. PMI_703]